MKIKYLIPASGANSLGSAGTGCYPVGQLVYRTNSGLGGSSSQEFLCHQGKGIQSIYDRAYTKLTGI